MKSITYKDRNFLYEVEAFACGDYGTFNCYETVFYDAIHTVKTRKKWWLFGPIVEYNVYNKLFKLYCNIESPGITDIEIRALLDIEIVLLNRRNEINKGNII